MDPLEELERRHIEEQLGGVREEIAEIKAELRSLLRLARQWQRDMVEKKANDDPNAS